MLQLSTIKLCKSAQHATTMTYSNAGLQPRVNDACTTILIWVIPNQHFKSTLLGGGERVTKKSTLCTLVKMMTILDDPLGVCEPTFSSWGCGGRCKPPSGVRGRAPEANAFWQ